MDLTEIVRNSTPEDVSIDQYAWALGLFAHEALGRKSRLEAVDFRRGKYAYKPAWGSLWSALQQELVYIVLAIVLGVAWISTKWITTHRALSAVDSRIAAASTASGVDETVPYKREAVFFQEKVDDLEKQLRSMGSLSSLSPLQSLKELSQLIDPNIDIDLDSVNIGFSRILLRGTVADTPTLGRLEAVLKKGNNFRTVNVDPKGNAPRSSRKKFTAEIELEE